MKEGVVSSLLGAGFEVTFAADGNIGVSLESIHDRFGGIPSEIAVKRLAVVTGTPLDLIGEDDIYIYVTDRDR